MTLDFLERWRAISGAAAKEWWRWSSRTHVIQFYLVIRDTWESNANNHSWISLNASKGLISLKFAQFVHCTGPITIWLLHVCGLKGVWHQIRCPRPSRSTSETLQGLWHQHRHARPAWWCQPNGPLPKEVHQGWGTYSGGSSSPGASRFVFQHLLWHHRMFSQTMMFNHGFLELYGSGIAWLFWNCSLCFVPKQVVSVFTFLQNLFALCWRGYICLSSQNMTSEAIGFQGLPPGWHRT